MSSTPQAYPKLKDRREFLAAQRIKKMAKSAHAFTRGSTAKFYEWLATNKPGNLPEGAPIWICGDCHVGNLGPIADAAGHVEILIRDLDQTVIGNPAHDIIRLGLSMTTSVRDANLSGTATVKMIETMIEAYRQAFEEDGVDDQTKVPKLVRGVIEEAIDRKWRHLVRERMEGRKLAIPLGKRFWPVSNEERKALHELTESDGVRRLVTQIAGRENDARIELIEGAYWVKGCSSLGNLRYALIVGVGKSAGDFCLLDVKEAVAAAAPRAPKAPMPRSNGERVVEGARNLSSALGNRMRSAELMGKSVVVRELLPQDLKLEIENLTVEQAVEVGRALAGVVGRAHASQMDHPARRSWAAELKRNHSKSLEAPSWYWRSVVDLLGIHETAYLEHCRKVAYRSELANA